MIQKPKRNCQIWAKGHSESILDVHKAGGKLHLVSSVILKTIAVAGIQQHISSQLPNTSDKLKMLVIHNNE